MDREDARTVSQVVLTMGAGHWDFSYRERQADGPGYGPPRTVQLALDNPA